MFASCTEHARAFVVRPPSFRQWVNRRPLLGGLFCFNLQLLKTKHTFICLHSLLHFFHLQEQESHSDNISRNMLEYFAYQKFKKNKAEKEAARQESGANVADRRHSHKASPQHLKKDHHRRHSHDSRRRSSSDLDHASPVLDASDEAWIQNILDNAEDGPPPPLPPRIKTPQLDLSPDGSTASSRRASKETEDPGTSKKDKKKADKKGKKLEKEKSKEDKQPSRFSLIFTRNKTHGDSLKPDGDIPPQEAEREEKDLSNVLDRMNLSAKNNKVISLSNESSELLQRFTQIFKDLVNGVPTAYGDLTGLIEDRDGTLNKGFSKLPSSLQKLVTQLPDKLTTSLAPEILAAAAESQGLKASTDKGIKESAKSMLTPQNLTQLVTKPGAVVSMLKAIVNALRVRWPAFIGTNVIWSVALFCKFVVVLNAGGCAAI